jgi:hypothetical protein
LTFTMSTGGIYVVNTEAVTNETVRVDFREPT